MVAPKPTFVGLCKSVAYDCCREVSIELRTLLAAIKNHLSFGRQTIRHQWVPVVQASPKVVQEKQRRLVGIGITPTSIRELIAAHLNKLGGHCPMGVVHSETLLWHKDLACEKIKCARHESGVELEDSSMTRIGINDQCAVR